jgi:GNAT superfamily N-acetyltransferase
VTGPGPTDAAESAARSERTFVLALGGYALEIAGASLVTHERIPLPRFNHVVVGRVSPERQTAFFERALDHYFQRALRPAVRVPVPVPPHIDAGLRRFAFRPRAAPYTLWVRNTGAPGPRTLRGAACVEVAPPDDVGSLVGLWAQGTVREELRRSLEVLERHPNPGDRTRALVATRKGELLGTAVVHESGEQVGLHGVTTVEGERGRGVATALVSEALALLSDRPGRPVVLASDALEVSRRLAELGFAPVLEYAEYELPTDAQLTLPEPGPAQPPRWRPPRSG